MKAMSQAIPKKKVSGKQHVLLIQDLHGNAQVQHTIADILEYYDAKGLVGEHIFVEGTEGPIDSKTLAELKPAEFQKKVLDSLLETADITGAEYFAARKGKVSMLYGIDDYETYQKHLENFKAFYKEQAATSQYIKDMQKQASEELMAANNLHMTTWLNGYRDYSKGKDADFPKDIIDASHDLGISLDRDYPALARYRASYRTQSRLDTVDIGAMQSELRILTYDVCFKLANNPKEKVLINAVFGLDYLGNFIARRITSQEFDKFFQQTISLDKYMRDKNSISLYQAVKQAGDFYWLAYERDSLMAENIVYQMTDKNLDRAIVITGGFHSSGIAEILAKRGISCSILTPNVESHTKADTQLPFLSMLSPKHAKAQESQYHLQQHFFRQT